MTRLPGAAAAGALAALSACTSHPAAEVIVTVRAEPETLSRAHAFHVEVDGDGSGSVLDKKIAVDPGAAELARVPLIPRDGDATRRFSLHAELLDETGAAFSELRASGGYRDRALGE